MNNNHNNNSNTSSNSNNNNNHQGDSPPLFNADDGSLTSANTSFVVFQQPGRESENVVYSLPWSLRAPFFPRLQTEQSQSESQYVQPAQENNRSENVNQENTSSPRFDPHTQRNMYVSVTYMYTQAQLVNANTPEERVIPLARTGTILLSVPDIPANRSDSEIGQLVEFAASIALSAIAANGLTRNQGIKVESFEKFEIIARDQTQDNNTCPICFEDYLFEDNEVQVDEIDMDKLGDKRKRTKKDDDSLEERLTKKARLSTNDTPQTESVDTDLPSSSSSTIRPLSNLNPLTGNTTQTHIFNEPKYIHVAIRLPCGHVFGRDCLYEWLKTKDSCPLCRTVVHKDIHQVNVPDRVTVPNIESFLSPSTRDRPMVVNFDRTALTLTVSPTGLEPSATEETANRPSPQHVSIRPHVHSPFRPQRSVRNDEVREQLENLNRINTDSLFPAGVMSRRNNRGDNVFQTEDLFDQLTGPLLGEESESSRILRERILERLSQRRTQIMSRMRGRDISSRSGSGDDNISNNNATQEEMDSLNELGTITENVSGSGDDTEASRSSSSSSSGRNHGESNNDGGGSAAPNEDSTGQGQE